MKKDDPILSEAIEVFGRCEDRESLNRREAESDIRFARLSEQWPENIRKQRELDRRPVLTINKLGPIIRQVVNDARQNRPSIKVLPADSKADPETAEVISGLIRNIEQASNADVAYDTGVDQAVSGGFGYWRVNLRYTNEFPADADLSALGPEVFEQDIAIERIANQFAVFGDPDSTAADSSDWNVCFVIDDMPHATFKKRFPNAAETDFSSDAYQTTTGWVTEDSVRVAEYWKRERAQKRIIGVQKPDGEPVVMVAEEWEKLVKEGQTEGWEVVTLPRVIDCYKVTQYLLTAVEVLETTEWPGTYIPIVPVYGDEVNLKGVRYLRSLIRDAKDSSRMNNYWRTMATELVALAPKAPFIGRKGAFETDVSKWATANTANHSYIEYDGAEAPQRQPFAGVPAGALQEALNASDDIKAVTGIYDASLGAKSNETSGKAIMARQREGDVSTFHFIDNLTRAIRHTGRIILDLIPKVYSTARIIRIMGEDGTPEDRQIKQEYEVANDNGDAIIRMHDLRVGRYDLTVTAGPGFTTRREEAATQMIELIRAYPDAAPLIGDLLAKNLDWPGADEIAKRLEKMLPPQLRDEQGGIPPNVQQDMQQMAQALQVLQQRLAQAEDKNAIDRAKIGVDQYKAETDRMTAVQGAMTPEAVQMIVLQTMRDLMVPNELPQGEGQTGPTGGAPEPSGLAA